MTYKRDISYREINVIEEITKYITLCTNWILMNRTQVQNFPMVTFEQIHSINKCCTYNKNKRHVIVWKTTVDFRSFEKGKCAKNLATFFSSLRQPWFIKTYSEQSFKFYNLAIFLVFITSYLLSIFNLSSRRLLPLEPPLNIW